MIKHITLLFFAVSLHASAVVAPSDITPIWFKIPQQVKSLPDIQAQPVATVAPIEVAKPVAPVISSSVVNGCGDVFLCNIIGHESGNNPFAINKSSGACGLGQALPCSKLLNVCGSLGNINCQITYFTNYCISAYGSTYNAWAFWQSHSWY